MRRSLRRFADKPAKLFVNATPLVAGNPAQLPTKGDFRGLSVQGVDGVSGRATHGVRVYKKR